MAKYTDVELLKQHLNIDFMESGEESYLNTLLDAAEGRIKKEINQPLETFAVEDKLDSVLVCAILIFAGNLYANREPVSYGNVKAIPFTLSYLIQPYRLYT